MTALILQLYSYISSDIAIIKSGDVFYLQIIIWRIDISQPIPKLIAKAVRPYT